MQSFHSGLLLTSSYIIDQAGQTITDAQPLTIQTPKADAIFDVLGFPSGSGCCGTFPARVASNAHAQYILRAHARQVNSLKV